MVSQFSIQEEDTWNMDETGCFIGVNKASHAVVPKSYKQAYINDPQNREWVALIETIPGVGKYVPPHIILTGKVHLSGWYQTKVPSDYVLGCTESGFTNNAIGLQWLRRFDKYSYSSKPRLPLTDGHDSHVTVDFHLLRCFIHALYIIHPTLAYWWQGIPVWVQR